MNAADPLAQLPPDLPVPTDDGACDHLPGAAIPSLQLAATSGEAVDLAGLAGRTIVFCYPRTGRPDVPVPAEWDAIPGARGCTTEAYGFREHADELSRLDVAVFGMSTQTTEEQAEVAARLQLPFALLSDADLRLTDALALPTFTFEGRTLVRRLTLVIDDAVVTHCFYPVFPPDTHAREVLDWLRRG